MTAILFLIFGAAVFVVISTRFTLISLFIISSCVYSLPAFWLSDIPAVVLISWFLVFALSITAQITLSGNLSRSDPYTGFGKTMRIDERSAIITNLVFNCSTLILFLLLAYLHGGIGIFFKGKYSGVASTALLYYSWNSLLLITAVHNLICRGFSSPWSVIGIFQILLLFIGGDRTIPVMFFAAVVYNYFRGATPLAMPKRARVLMVLLPVILPLIVISKSIYTVLPKHGFSIRTAELIGQNFSDWAVKDFEPSHTMIMFKSIALSGLPYGWSDLFRGLPAILPFSSYMNIDPHIFSEMVKRRFYSSWGPDAGVGANFWAQGYVLFGLAGVLMFSVLVILSLRYFERAIARTSSSAARATFLACGVIVAFYVHRNSLEQILAFLGRYAAIGLLAGLIGGIASNSIRSRDRNIRLKASPFEHRQLGTMPIEREDRRRTGSNG